jgi:hypothetical protein
MNCRADCRLPVSGSLFSDFHNGREHERFAGRAISVPRIPVDRPSRELLKWHAAEVFRGCRPRHPRAHRTEPLLGEVGPAAPRCQADVDDARDLACPQEPDDLVDGALLVADGEDGLLLCHGISLRSLLTSVYVRGRSDSLTLRAPIVWGSVMLAAPSVAS